ncbi:hypothetical protein N182_36670 [Sinorhizobium sp. GL2]|nr:hypothetical protein N182_36670 [Sinorhizobium sp. GL2]
MLPALQRELFLAALDKLIHRNILVNEFIEMTMEGNEAILRRYALPE